MCYNEHMKYLTTRLLISRLKNKHAYVCDYQIGERVNIIDRDGEHEGTITRVWKTKDADVRYSVLVKDGDIRYSVPVLMSRVTIK